MVHESMDDTMLQLGFERIKQADGGYGYLKSAAVGNVALTAVEENIATQFAGQGKKANVPITTITLSGLVTINNAVVGTNFENLDNTILKMSSNGVDVLAVLAI